MINNHTQLETGHAHIHLLFPEKVDNVLKERYHALLSIQEKDKYNKLKNPKVKNQYLLTRGLVRTILPHYLEVKPQEISFSYNEHGKPELVINQNQPNIRFNISHTEGLISLAVTLENDIGIDVEDTTRKNTTIDIARRFFSISEVENLQKTPKDEQNSRFFDFWTLKEAYIKARGTGLTLPLSKFSFTLEETVIAQNHVVKEKSTSIVPPLCSKGEGGFPHDFEQLQESEPKVFFEPELNDDSSLWSFWLSSPTEKHRLALAMKTPSLSVTLIDIR